jgi:uncharacterized CHY-type Zn-finger protein
MTCPGCKKDIPEGAIICPECKVYVKIALKNQKSCPFCTERIEIDAVFCKHCKKDLTADLREWYKKRRYIIPLILAEIVIIGTLIMFLIDFTLIFKEIKYRNNRLEIISELANALDSYKDIDSLIKYEVSSNKQLTIEFLTFSYTKRSLQLANYNLIKKMSALLLLESNRIDNIKIIGHTPTGGSFVSINSMGDISKINIGSWDFIAWLQNTNFAEVDIF